jgi:hypothetical protein
LQQAYTIENFVLHTNLYLGHDDQEKLMFHVAGNKTMQA